MPAWIVKEICMQKVRWENGQIEEQSDKSDILRHIHIILRKMRSQTPRIIWFSCSNCTPYYILNVATCNLQKINCCSKQQSAFTS